LVYCLDVHPYVSHELCECAGLCHFCSHVGCERCMEQAYRDLPWWRKIFRRSTIVERH